MITAVTSAIVVKAMNPVPLPCRLPDIDTEYRVIIQYRDASGTLKETCSIEPRNLEKGRRAMMDHLMRRREANVQSR